MRRGIYFFFACFCFVDLRRNLHQVRPRAPTYMILGYQSACREWDRSRRNVAAYAVSVFFCSLSNLFYFALGHTLQPS